MPEPAAAECLIYDSRTVRLIVRRDFALEADRSAGFARDVAVYRLIGRFAVGVPVPNKAIRKLTIADAAPARWRPDCRAKSQPAEPASRATSPPASLGPALNSWPGPRSRPRDGRAPSARQAEF